jgi:bifunctional non-homologous end joining protein LigD
MLAVAGEPPADERGWAYEFKYDGLRARAIVDADGVDLVSRNGNVLTRSYPELAVLSELAAGRELVLDGEIVSLSRTGRPDFGQLQDRMHHRLPSAALIAATPVSYIAFDLLALDGQDLTGEPYETRRTVLASLALSRPPAVQVPPHYADLSAEQLLGIAVDHGLEGLVAKRLASRYRPGRSKDWIKIPLRRTCETIIGGWQPGTGRHAGTVGALLLGAHDHDGRLVYLGHVGSGLTDQLRDAMREGFAQIEIRRSPFDSPVAPDRARGAHWLRPVLVAEVNYREITTDHQLRHPSWRGLRTDIDPDQVTIPSRNQPSELQ